MISVVPAGIYCLGALVHNYGLSVQVFQVFNPPLPLWERDGVRGALVSFPHIRPSATFSLKEKGC
ncbi:MAG: hypothetical protein C0616_00170 [Desulfuromonas sp.]|nr:MAG: hypothetical protein C0616_00170 [Desulfuromonas sp.]